MVVGLRNPGSDYEGTRHNVGFEVVARVVARHGSRFGRAPSRVRCEVAQVGAGDNRVLYVVPSTFMNESGSAVRAAVDYYGLDLSRILVVHDDIDLAFARLRLQVNGGSGGHNGIRSLENALGPNFSRLKLGVGRPPGSMDPADFVLRSFSRTERVEVDVMLEEAADVVEQWLSDPARAQEMAALRGRNPLS
ncbi:MAG: aminoacyl-tRNA hydrolase [Acidimicrobiia bacterium]